MLWCKFQDSVYIYVYLFCGFVNKNKISAIWIMINLAKLNSFK